VTPSYLALIGSAVYLLVLSAACSKSESESEPEPSAEPTSSTPEEANYQESPAPRLQWKRYAALEADLVRALELDPDELCNEFGTESCIRRVHLVPLGGHDPFATGLLIPSSETLATTPAAVDRVLLSACARRVELDQQAGNSEAQVFTQFDLNEDAPAPKSDAAHDAVVNLYRRLLGRDPDAHEVRMVAALARDDGKPRSASEFAILSCFAVGTTTEFLFF
jgi:hypothetical protein